jgi:S-DNA-T family DNA segregation ATPase FtsK/SpoIIIE
MNINNPTKIKKKIDFIWSFVCITSLSTLLEVVKNTFKPMICGGYIGYNLCLFLKFFFEIWLSFAILIIVFFISFMKLLGISIIPYVFCLFRKFKEKRCVINNNERLFNSKIQPNKLDLESYELKHIKPNIVQKQENRISKNNDESKEPIVIKHEKKTNDTVFFNYKLPTTNLLDLDPINFKVNNSELLDKASLLRNTLADFDITAEVKDIIPGPVVTRYDLVLAPGIRVQSVSNVIDNISLAMRASSIRIVPIPEKSVVGIEVPNSSSIVVGLRGIVESDTFKNSKSLLTLALGKTTDGIGYVANLISMPHLLIAGATGSGKSIGIHTMILSILYKARPDEVKFTLIDPKRVEMLIYEDIPHIYNPCSSGADASIITNPREAVSALKKLVVIMNERYLKFAKETVRNIEDYNRKMSELGAEKEFYIVVIIDEFADLMLVVQKEIEDSIQRLAQMARAVGIHLILATQRPSVNVITGIIKANFPARLSFQTTSKTDSRVILDLLGAECLVGRGDMLFMPPGEAIPVRLQGAYISSKEAERIVSFINAQKFPKLYRPVVIEIENKNDLSSGKNKDLVPALRLISERKRISQDLLKANFGSSARATNILSILETEGFIMKPNGTNKWHIYYEKIKQYLEKNSMQDKY